jgi:hypothetical protein
MTRVMFLGAALVSADPRGRALMPRQSGTQNPTARPVITWP